MFVLLGRYSWRAQPFPRPIAEYVLPDGEEVNRRAKEVAKSIFAEADAYGDEKAKSVRKWAWMCCGKSRLDAMREMAISRAR